MHQRKPGHATVAWSRARRSSSPSGSFIIGAQGGTANDPVVIQSSGAPRASVRAQAWLQEASHDITFTDLNFIGTPNDVGASMLIIDGDRIVFRNNEITYVNGICVDVGNMDGQGGAVGDPADDFVLDRNRIHNCGTSRPMNDLGASGLHGVYIQNTNHALVTNNVIFDNMNRGVQLYPLAQNTLVEFNVLDGNSSNLNMGGYEPENRFSDNNVARNNIITNALLKTYFVPGLARGWRHLVRRRQLPAESTSYERGDGQLPLVRRSKSSTDVLLLRRVRDQLGTEYVRRSTLRQSSRQGFLPPGWKPMRWEGTAARGHDHLQRLRRPPSPAPPATTPSPGLPAWT